ncbi:HD-GYP domain-containing protein [Clostridium neonatale]|uniref:HD-GYP domain-containing protein n=1 Tax=Clostridium neonatale TaxID=137838 RepID=UPI003D32C26C
MKTILIKEDIISPKGVIIIPKGKLLKLDLITIDRLKSHGVYYEVLESKNNSSQHEQTKNSFSNEISIKEYMLSDNDNNISLNMLNHNNSKKYRIISNLMNEFVFDGRNEEWYLYLKTLLNGYSWHYSHSINVAGISTMIGLSLGYTKEQLDHLILGSLLHDVGVILLPKNILLKDRNLFTSEEKAIFEKHSSLGYEMVKNLSISETCKRIVLDHHKLLNGNGYPNSEEDDELSIESKIVMVSDYFDSETTNKKPPKDIITYLVDNPDKFPIEIVSILKNVFNL